MSDMKVVSNYYFRFISAIYLCAFASIYTQIPGLYGDNGILPVRWFAQIDSRGVKALTQAFERQPSLVWLAPSMGISLTSALELIALFGIVISFTQILFASWRNFTMYSLLLVGYFSIYQVGQTFMWFQWDLLLLEAGVLTALASTLNVPFLPNNGPQNSIMLWLIRWLLFRLMFASGVVKLTSGCQTWWGLTALDIHFESQCIPNQFSWFAHHLPKWFLKYSVVSTYVIEIAVPFLFFIPIRNLRKFAFISQVFFQVCIILTGNYNFFNLLTIALCLPLLNDSYIGDNKSDNEHKPRLLLPKYMQKLITAFVYFSLIYWTIKLFNIKFVSGSLSMNFILNKTQFNQLVHWSVVISISMATISLICNIFLAIFRCLILPTNAFKRFAHVLVTLLYSWIAIFMFAISLVPHTSVDPTNSIQVWPVINKWHKSVEAFHLVNSYGLFRRMTGVNGRPEIIVEGSNDISSNEWKEYHFMYKPGDIAQSPKFIVPHQPRLDWQMWFAALDTYRNNPWLLHLCYRLLTGQTEVLQLLDSKTLPFQKPPKYIRIRSYNYRYTGKNAKNWWRRENEAEYMPAVTKESLKEYLIQNGYDLERKIDLNDKYPTVQNTLKSIRTLTSRFTPTSFVYSLLTAAIFIATLQY